MKMVVCVRSDLSMTVGKVAAQVGHAVHANILESKWQDLQRWDADGGKKITLRVESEEQLKEIEQAAGQRGIVANSIEDAGHTEVPPGTLTVVGLGPAANKDMDAVTGHLKPIQDRAQKL